MNDILVAVDKKIKIRRLFYLIVTGLVTGLYALISGLTSMPYAEGWNSYFARCMNNGQQIYQDFSYMFWPMFQNIITAITDIAGYDIYILRLIGAVVFALIAISFYLIFTKIVKPGYAMIAATCGAFYLQSEIVQVFYDYVRFMDLFSSLSTFFLLCTFHEKIMKKDGKLSKSLIYSVVAGVFTALFTCTKQNMGILFFVFAICLFVFFEVIWSKKQLWATLVSYVLTYVAIVISTLALSLGDTTIIEFYNITISSASSAKGGIITILFNWIKNGLPIFSEQVTLVLLLFAILILNVLFNKEVVKNKILNFKPVINTKNFFGYYFKKIQKCYADYIKNHTGISAKLLNGFVKFICKIIKIATKYIRIEHLYFFALFFIIVLGSKNEAIGNFFSTKFHLSQYAIYLFDIIVFAYCVVKIIICKIKKIEIKTVYPVFCILCGSVFAIGYGCGTSGGLSQGELGLGLGILICILMYNFRSKLGNVFKILTVCATCAVSATCITFKYVNPYNWWGMTQPSIYECTYHTDIPLFKNIYMSEQTGKIYEEIVHNIIDNTTPDDKIFCFPHIPVFYLASERDDIGTHSKVQWFDVCSDEIVDNDIEYLKNNPPKAIVVYNVPDWVQSSHETMFRNGNKSSMRKMGEYLYDFAIANGYTFYGEYSINSDNSISLYIDDGKSHFDFYESGSGTNNDPFIINSKEQLLAFSKMVESGWSFENKFLALGNDIDLKNEEWEPIGNYEENLSFKGSFDGRGHKIKNLKITDCKEAGFFAYLSGDVYNLGFEGGTISGDLCGAIAVYCDGLIANCYSSVTLNGEVCGVIAGKTSGTICNCLYFGQIMDCVNYNIALDIGGMEVFDCYLTESSTSSLGIRQISFFSPNNYYISDEILSSLKLIDSLNNNIQTYSSQDKLYHSFILGTDNTPELSDEWVINIDNSKLYVTKSSGDKENERKNCDYLTVIPGSIQYGPYMSLNSGNYTIAIYGENLADADYDVFSSKLDYYPAILNMKKTDTCVSFNISTETPMEDVEIRTLNNNESNVYIDHIIIKGVN